MCFLSYEINCRVAIEPDKREGIIMLKQEIEYIRFIRPLNIIIYIVFVTTRYKFRGRQIGSTKNERIHKFVLTTMLYIHI